MHLDSKHMKLTTILKAVRLYQPAIRFKDDWGFGLIFFKKLLYLRRLQLHDRNQNAQNFGPSVLVVTHIGGIGNAIEATPLVQGVRSLWPRAIITLLVPPGDLFDHWCIPDKIVKNPNELNGNVYDHTFHAFHGGKVPVQLQSNCTQGQIHYPRIFLNKWFLKSEVEYNLDMLRPLGYRGGAPPLYTSIKKPDRELAEATLKICLLPGGKNSPSWLAKRWPYFSELAVNLLERYPQAHLFVMGTKEDQLSDQMFQNEKITDLRGQHSLGETAWVLKNMDLAIGNDCGPMHIADAVQTRSLVLFGPTCEIKNSPIHKGISLRSQPSCWPCKSYVKTNHCDDSSCLAKLTTSQVMEKVKMFFK
jgi:heptosyltransferase-3